MNELVKLIGECVKVFPRPAAYISGGLDSAILLHHLSDKSGEQIYTYTFGFEDQQNEFEGANKLAEHYGRGGKHQNITIDEMLPRFPEILKNMPSPRFTLWVYWVAEKANLDKRQTCYVAEGMDEHFGGYWYKPRRSYLENWTGLYQWGIPTYQAIHKIFGLRFEAPFLYLDWRKTYPYYDSEQHKYWLRQAYKNVLPDFVLERKKNPASRDYWLLWNKELSRHFPGWTPKSESEIRELWQAWVTREWVKLHTQ